MVYPPETSNYHDETEFVVGIGKAGFRIAGAHSLDHVFGYPCGSDMTVGICRVRPTEAASVGYQ